MEGYKTISISDGCHARLVAHAREMNDSKLLSMVEAYQRAWMLLTPEQQMQAIRGNAASDLAPLCGKCGEGLPTIINRLQRDALDIDEAVDRAMEDGMLTETEKASLRPLLRKVWHRVETAAAEIR
jgi:hypothetical protein